MTVSKTTPSNPSTDEKKIEELQKKLKQSLASEANLNDMLANLQVELFRLDQQRVADEATKQDLTDQVGTLEAESSRLQTIAETRSIETAEIAAREAALTEELARLEADLSKAEDSLIALSKARDEETSRLKNALARKEQALNASASALAAMRAENENLRARNASLLNSTSWRITRPIRWLKRAVSS